MTKIIECPRDAMQGIEEHIPAEQKAEYINLLLKIGFDTIDFGSFVNPKAIPQMADTVDVLRQLNLEESRSKLLAIVANERGAKDACNFDEIDYLGFPFSVSPTFQQKNTNANQQEAVDRIKRIQNLVLQKNKQLVVYLSMAFGNPYGDEWNTDEVERWAEQLAAIEIPILALADTVGVANPETISLLFNELIPRYRSIEFGAHLHSRPENWKEKVNAAQEAGCERFDSSFNGIGGCPMAADELVGNIATEQLIMHLAEEGADLQHLNQECLLDAVKLARKVMMLG